MKASFHFGNFVGVGVRWGFSATYSLIGIQLPFLYINFERSHIPEILGNPKR